MNESIKGSPWLDGVLRYFEGEMLGVGLERGQSKRQLLACNPLGSVVKESDVIRDSRPTISSPAMIPDINRD